MVMMLIESDKCAKNEKKKKNKKKKVWESRMWKGLGYVSAEEFCCQ